VSAFVLVTKVLSFSGCFQSQEFVVDDASSRVSFPSNIKNQEFMFLQSMLESSGGMSQEGPESAEL
jgi:hypothetical protein